MTARNLESITDELMQVQAAYQHDGPAYLLDRMITLIAEMRAWCDGAEQHVQDLRGTEEVNG